MPWGRRSTALVTGRPPFQAATAMDTLLQVVERGAGAAAAAECRRSPRDLETICLKCLEKDPGAVRLGGGAGRRPAAVPGWRADRGAAGERDSERAGEWCRRRPAIAGAGPLRCRSRCCGGLTRTQLGPGAPHLERRPSWPSRSLRRRPKSPRPRKREQTELAQRTALRRAA